MEVGSRIPEKLFFRIGEVCELIKVQPHVLRYWETEFPMLAPQKNRAGQRVYRRKDVEMVLRIRDLLYEEKFTIAGAKKRLQEETRSGVSKPKAPAPEEQVSATPSTKEKHLAPTEAPDAPGSTALLPGMQPSQTQASEPITAHAKRILRLLRTDLEDLLTRLNSDVTLNR